MTPLARAPKHAQIAENIRRLIRQGKVPVGEAIPTEHALCKMFNCSRGTVRRALDTLVQEGIVRRKHGSGHYAAKRTGSRQMLLGLIVPNILNAEVLRIAQLLTLEAGRMGYGIVLSMTNEQSAVERQFIRELSRLKAAGVIKFPTLPETAGFESDIRSQLRTLALPCVIINDFWTDTAHDHHVAFDEGAALEMAVEHLTALGHKRIGWVDGSDGPRRSALRALREALARRKLTLPDKQVLFCPPYDTPPVERLWPGKQPGPTALITPYDGMAVRLVETLPRTGRRVPQDVSVVNLNGQSFYSTQGLDLTTAVPPYDRIVEKALEILTQGDRDLGVCHCIFRPSFHAGSSSGPARRQDLRQT